MGTPPRCSHCGTPYNVVDAQPGSRQTCSACGYSEWIPEEVGYAKPTDDHTQNRDSTIPPFSSTSNDNEGECTFSCHVSEILSRVTTESITYSFIAAMLLVSLFPLVVQLFSFLGYTFLTTVFVVVFCIFTASTVLLAFRVGKQGRLLLGIFIGMAIFACLTYRRINAVCIERQHHESTAIATTSYKVTTPTPCTLVIIVPGTYGNEGFWPNVIEDKVTFGSELRRAVGARCDVYPFLWASSIKNQNREEAAKNLASLIDERSKGYDRVCLVGHSHGGNVALLAASHCARQIDMIVCLSTPHVYLRTISDQNENLFLPIYCSPQTWRNTHAIVSIAPDTDLVPDDISNATLTGLTENEAIGLTTAWREATNHPRLANDSIGFRLFESGNIVADRNLCPYLDQVYNVKVYSLVKGISEPHSAIHSRRMGYVIGELIRDGATPGRLAYLRSLIQPMSADNGTPIAANHSSSSFLWEKEPWCRNCVGWILQKASVTISHDAYQHAGNKDPDPYLRMVITGGSQHETDFRLNAYSATWNPDWFLPRGCIVNLKVLDWNGIYSPTSLGTYRVSTNSSPPESFQGTPAQGIYWNATIIWKSVHL